MPDDQLADLLARHPAPWTLRRKCSYTDADAVDANGRLVAHLTEAEIVAAVNAAAALRAGQPKSLQERIDHEKQRPIEPRIDRERIMDSTLGDRVSRSMRPPKEDT